MPHIFIVYVTRVHITQEDQLGDVRGNPVQFTVAMSSTVRLVSFPSTLGEEADHTG